MFEVAGLWTCCWERNEEGQMEAIADALVSAVTHLKADGWRPDFFQVLGKAARRRRLERRKRGKPHQEQG
jgi:hypothetical protein